MCGRLKFSWQCEKRVLTPGDTFPKDVELIINGEKFQGSAFWQGHARSENLEKWTNGNWTEGTLKIETYHEKGREFRVPKDKVIKIIALPGKPKVPVNLITREAETPEEKAVWNRHPLLTEKPNEIR